MEQTGSGRRYSHGGGRGIGRAIPLSLARRSRRRGRRTDGAGITETAALIEAAGGRSIALSVDVRMQPAVGQPSPTTRRLGPVTVLVSSCRHARPAGSTGGRSDPWFECIDVIVRGSLLLCQAVVPGMIQRGSGRIINIASISGTRAFPPIIATSIAKTALIRFSESLAAQLRDQGIHVFAVHPGVVRTRLLESYGLTLPEEWFVGPERAGTLCAQLASGTTGCRDALSELTTISTRSLVESMTSLRGSTRSVSNVTAARACSCMTRSSSAPLCWCTHRCSRT